MQGHKFNFWSEKIPHASGQLSPTTRALQQEKPPQWEVYAPKLESSPHLLQLEKVHVQWRPKAAKIKIN